MKRSAGTLLEKHGFADSDLYMSAHDKIQMWVMDNRKTLFGQTASHVRVEVPITAKAMNNLNRTGPIVGFMDCVVHANERKYYMEIKTKIESFGGILRELQFYRHHIDDGRVCLVCPPLDYAQRIRDQGFEVFEVPSDVLK